MTKTGEQALTYFLFALHSISISLHILGIYLLSFQIKKDRSHQVSIMMNLSIAEIFMSVFDVTYNIMVSRNVDKNIREYVYTVQCTCFVISCFLILTVLTLDRFFEVYLNITYPVFFTKKVLQRCLISCWIIGFSLGLILCVLRYTIQIDTLDVVFRILFPAFEIIFFSCAVVTYTYIYSKFRKLSHDPNKSRNEKIGKKKFFVPTLIIFTFFLFAIIPDQLHLFLFYIFNIGSNILLNIILVLYVIGFICDAVIYIFFQKTTYNILCKKFRNLFSNNIVRPEGSSFERTRRRSNAVSVVVNEPAQSQERPESLNCSQTHLKVPKN